MPPLSPADLKNVMQVAATSLLAHPHELRTTVEVEAECNGVRCFISMGPTNIASTPTVKAGRKKDGDRTVCRRDIMAVMTAATGPLIRKKIVAALRDARTPHPIGTVAKALAELTSPELGQLVNPRDRKGYRLASVWQRNLTPSLFNVTDDAEE